MSTDNRLLDIEVIGDVTVVKFVDKKLIDDMQIYNIGNQLFALFDDDGRHRLVLDFSNVEFVTTQMLGLLVKLNNKAKAANLSQNVQTPQAKLILCCIAPDFYNIIKVCNLHRAFDIKPNVDEALEDF